MNHMDYMVTALKESGIPFQVNGLNISLSNNWMIAVNYTQTGLGHGVYAILKYGNVKKMTISTNSVVDFLSEQQGIFSQQEI